MLSNGRLLRNFCCLAMAFAALVIAAADCLAARVSSLSTAAAAVATFLSNFAACFAAAAAALATFLLNFAACFAALICLA